MAGGPPAIRVPQGVAIASDADQAAFRHGFPLRLGEEGGWSRHASTTVPGTIWLAAAAPEGPWWLATDRPAVLRAAGLSPAAMPGPGAARACLPTLPALWDALARLWPLWSTVPDDPVEAFRAATAHLPRTTEAERLVVQRIGQDLFRARLMALWGSRCPLTGITDPALLRASHIVPWAACETDEERLSEDNGLLLSALWDAAFDKGLVSFGDDGHPLFAPALSAAARRALAPERVVALPLTDGHRHRLAWHRAQVLRRDGLPD